MIAKPQTSRVGELIGGKYRIVRVLAEGGMGVVYEAQHIVVKRRFAVKFLRPDFADRREILTRFHISGTRTRSVTQTDVEKRRHP